MNHFTDALKQYANFEGRATRTQFWYFFLFSIIFSIVASVIDYVVLGEGSFVISGLYNLAILIPSLAIGARRLHDIGKSGWWQLIMLVPFIGVIWLIVLWATDTVGGKNQFDTEPATPVETPATPAA